MNIESIVINDPKRKVNNSQISIGWETTKETGYFSGISEVDIIYIAKKCDFQIIYTPLGIFGIGIIEGYKTVISSIGYHVDQKPIFRFSDKIYRVNDIYHEMGLKRPLKREMV